jgi:Bacterial Ig-like domain (group 2)
MRARYPFNALLSAAALLAACESTTGPELPPSDAGMTQVLNVAPSFATIEGQRVIKLTALLAGSAGGAPQDQVTWVSSDTNVATVASGGLVQGRKAGRVLITASYASARGSATIVVLNQVAKKPSSPPPCLASESEAELRIPGGGKC